MGDAGKAALLEAIRRGRGVDWFPSWATSPVEYWTASMPRATAARELRFVRGLGLDHVRIWLSAHGYEQDPPAYLDNLRDVLGTADGLGLGVVLELFDSCGVEPSRDEARPITVEQIPQLAAGTPELAAVARLGGDRGRDLFAGPGLVEVPWRGDALAAVWEGFVPNPGYALLGPQHWDRWDAYAAAVVDVVAEHPALWLIEVMNEPFISQLGHDIDHAPITAFYRHVAESVRRRAPGVPLAIGAAQPFIAAHDANLPDLDVISFHSLAGASALREAIDTAKEVARGRPVYLSEWGYFPGGPDEEQRTEIARLLPIVEAADIGWAITHLIAGYGPFANTALLYPNGVMRPAALDLRRHLIAEHRPATAGGVRA